MNANGVIVEDMIATRRYIRRLNAIYPVKKLRISRGFLPPELNPVIQMFQLHPEDGCLERIKAAVEAGDEVVIFLLAAVVSEHNHLFGNFRVAGYHHAAIAVGTENFAGKEAEATGITR